MLKLTAIAILFLASSALAQGPAVVVAIDGTRVFEQGCERWQERHRTETTLTVLREGETFDLQVEFAVIVP